MFLLIYSMYSHYYYNTFKGWEFTDWLQIWIGKWECAEKVWRKQVTFWQMKKGGDFFIMSPMPLHILLFMNYVHPSLTVKWWCNVYIWPWRSAKLENFECWNIGVALSHRQQRINWLKVLERQAKDLYKFHTVHDAIMLFTCITLCMSMRYKYKYPNKQKR